MTVAHKQPGCGSLQHTAKHVTFLKNNDSMHKWSLEASQWRCLFRQVMSSKQKPLHRAKDMHECRAPSRGQSSDLIGHEEQSSENRATKDTSKLTLCKCGFKIEIVFEKRETFDMQMLPKLFINSYSSQSKHVFFLYICCFMACAHANV